MNQKRRNNPKYAKYKSSGQRFRNKVKNIRKGFHKGMAKWTEEKENILLSKIRK